MDDYGVLTAPDTLRIERELPGPIERIWDYLTDSEKRGTWLASGPMDLRVGGEVEHVFRNSELTRDDDAPPKKYEKYAGESTLHGRITACEPPRLLSYMWGESSEVKFELSPRGESRAPRRDAHAPRLARRAAQRLGRLARAPRRSSRRGSPAPSRRASGARTRSSRRNTRGASRRTERHRAAATIAWNHGARRGRKPRRRDAMIRAPRCRGSGPSYNILIGVGR